MRVSEKSQEIIKCPYCEKLFDINIGLKILGESSFVNKPKDL